MPSEKLINSRDGIYTLETREEGSGSGRNGKIRFFLALLDQFSTPSLKPQTLPTPLLHTHSSLSSPLRVTQECLLFS